jgi:predicted phosphodiesterase
MNMTCAILSDIHGNVYALNAALADARACGTDKFLFIGDYASNLPWGNEVTDVLRGLENAVFIAGNGEGYLAAPPAPSIEQYRLAGWAYRTLSPENLKFLQSVPNTAVVREGSTDIYLQHSLPIFFRTERIHEFHSCHYKEKLADITQEEYLQLAGNALLARPDAMAELNALPAGIHLFGHNHLQWHMYHEDKLIINPGSCGEPLMNDTRAAYTLLTISGGNWQVEERRVEYDLAATLAAFDASEFNEYSPGWARVMRMTVSTGGDGFASFMTHLRETATTAGETLPVSNETWRKAVDTWNAS